MKILYVGLQHTITVFRPGGVRETHFAPVNHIWETREAYGLSRLGHEVIYVSDFVPGIRDVDVVFCCVDIALPLAHRYARTLKQQPKLVCQFISRLPDYKDPVWDEVRKLMPECHALTAVSPIVYESLVKWAEENGYSGPVELTPHGVDVELIDMVPDQGIGDVFTFVGALYGHKKVDDLIRVFAELNNPRLIIVGNGPEREKLEYLAEHLNAPVEFLGAVDEHTKFLVIKKSRAVLSASISEQFWIVGAEAMVAGRPVIARYIKNLYDIYGDHITYYEEPSELKDLVELCLDMDEESIKELGAVGREFILKETDIPLKKRSKRLIELFEEVCKYG